MCDDDDGGDNWSTRAASTKFGEIIINAPFCETEEKLLVKELGPDKPEINISQQIKVKDKCYKQSICRSWFNRKTWLAGCGAANALFCFPSSSEVTNVIRLGQRLD